MTSAAPQTRPSHYSLLTLPRRVRFVWVDESAGTLCYAKSQTDTSAVRSSVRLGEIASVELGGEGTRYDLLPAHSFVLKRVSEFKVLDKECIFQCEDREEAQMWITQLSARAAQYGGMSGVGSGDKAKSNGTSDEPPDLLSDDDEEEEEPAGPPPAKSPKNAEKAASSARAPQPSTYGVEVLPPSAPTASLPLQLARVKADFAAEHDCELGCLLGEMLLPTPWMPAPPGWSFAARPLGGQHGLVPTEYLELLPAVAMITGGPSAPVPSAAAAGGAAAATDVKEEAPAPAELSPKGAAARAQARAKARALQARPQPITTPQAEGASEEMAERVPAEAVDIGDDGAGVFERSQLPPSLRNADGHASAKARAGGSSRSRNDEAHPPPSPGSKRKQPPPGPPEPSPPPSAPSESGSASSPEAESEPVEHGTAVERGGAFISRRQQRQEEEANAQAAAETAAEAAAAADQREAEEAAATEAERLTAERAARKAAKRAARAAAAAEAERVAAEEAEAERLAAEALPIVAQGDGVAIVADAGFAEEDWDDEE